MDIKFLLITIFDLSVTAISITAKYKATSLECSVAFSTIIYNIKYWIHLTTLFQMTLAPAQLSQLHILHNMLTVQMVLNTDSNNTIINSTVMLNNAN